MTTGNPVAKALIRYNNNLKEKDEEEKKPINIGSPSKNRSWNDENASDFKWSGVQEKDEEDIALANFIERLQKQTDEELKKVTEWLFDDCSIIPNQKKIKKIILEVISNTKNFQHKILLNEITTTNIIPNSLGTRERETGQLEYGILFVFKQNSIKYCI